MIKNTLSNSVLSSCNPMVALRPRMKNIINIEFIPPIIEAFFVEKLGVENVEALDVDKLRTEVYFNEKTISFVNEYLYAELIQTISKNDTGIIDFKPRYVITFDRDLTPIRDQAVYPYEDIFGSKNYLSNSKEDNDKIHYGTIKLGKVPILYYILIDFQILTRYIKLKQTKEDLESPVQ